MQQSQHRSQCWKHCLKSSTEMLSRAGSESLFHESRKVCVGFVVVSPRLHVRAYQRVFHWRIFETMYWELVWKSVEKTLICVKCDKNIGHFTGRTKHTCVVNNNTKCFVARQGYKGNPFLYFAGRTHAVLHCWQQPAGQKHYKLRVLSLLHCSEHA